MLTLSAAECARGVIAMSAGMATAAKALNPAIEVYGVESKA